MRGLLKGKRGKSTLEFALAQSRFETTLGDFGSKSERNGTKPAHSERSSITKYGAIVCSYSATTYLFKTVSLSESPRTYSLIPEPSSLLSSLALRLLLRGHAVPLAKQRKKIQNQDACVYRPSCRGCVDARLHFRKCFIFAATSASSNDSGYRKSYERISFIRKSGDIHSHRYKHIGHRRQLEHHWRAGRERHAGNDHFCRRVHSSR